MNLIIKNDCELIEKTQLTDSTYFFKYRFAKDFIWKPGQYVGITINPTYRRSYSILDYDGENLSFLIDVRPGGPASIFFKDVEVGHKSQILGAYGKFVLQDTDFNKVFISTGTGCAPIIPMIKQLRISRPESRIRIYSGARYQKEDIMLNYIQPYINQFLEYNQCITRENPTADSTILKAHYGRVTKIFSELEMDWKNTEFYICGNPLMINDVEEILTSKGADKIFLERF